MFKLNLVLILYLITKVNSHSIVITTQEPSSSDKELTSTETNQKDDAYPVVPKIYEMKVETNVTNRFATTNVISKVKNLGKTAQEATFSVVLPETAYISGFIMEIGGKSYKAYVKEKEEAKKIYNEAVESGLSAGHIEVSARDSRRFTVSLNIEPETKAIFKLSYEELLQRQNGQYEIIINIHPGQIIKNLNVIVNINETRPIKFVKTPPLRSGNEISKKDNELESNAIINMLNNNSVTIKFSPDEEEQKQLAEKLGTPKSNGLAGQFIVQYDVERDPYGGEILIKDGYFVHFFAPEQQQPLNKHVIFILDTSGSMNGIRIKQLKEAMNRILTELKNFDLFNIVEFSSTVKVWDITKIMVTYQEGEENEPWWGPRELIPNTNKKNNTLPPAFEADDLNKENAKQVVEKLEAFGGTDIKSALQVGLKLAKRQKELNTKHQSLIIFLTDGEPTIGETATDKIISEIQKLNEAIRTPIFSLSFGDDADREFLQKISLKNNGFARHIYESADASLQLQEFYKTISSPLLSNVTFKYVSNVTKLTKTVFPIFFHGSEIIVAGSGFNNDPNFIPTIHSWGKNGPIDLIPKIDKTDGALERLWAYLTIKQILEARDAAENKEPYTKKALDLALKYSFVTPVSSLVVVKPNDTKAVDTEDASKTSNADRPYFLRGVAAKVSGHGYSSLSLSPSAFQSGNIRYALAPSASYPLYPLTTKLAMPYAYDFSVTEQILSTTLDYDVLEDLKSKLNWLESNLNDDGTLKLPSGNYKLGINDTVTDHPECPKTPTNNTIGVCQLLKDCPTVYFILKNVEVFKEFFCSLGEFAGICCPA